MPDNSPSHMTLPLASNDRKFKSNFTTVDPGAYWGAYQQISELNVNLNIFERLWAAWYQYMDNDVLATGIMSFMMHEIVYFGRSLPWMVIDATPYFRKYKLQPSKIPTAREQWECTKRVLLLHFTVELPQIWQFHPLCRAVGLSTTTPFPTFTTMFLQIALFFVLEDTWHYWAHRAFHWGPLYRYVHKIHHTYSAPFGLAAEYASPIEVLSLGLGTIGPPLLWCALTGDLHLVTMYTWTFLRLLQAVDSHSGYDFPWSLNKFLPIWAGAEHHDVHHEKFVGNYASSFRWWDYFMDTEAGPEAAKRRRERKMKKEAEAMAKAKTQ